ncbi:hypothetical protein JTE90_010350 [Oedothorax gibbosus]|uniref:Metalloendopeptidase n=1 Tax=Oedothorax gibbosus TaxID=931172 RepID=A0AAV6U2G4_9ARAC|nr:hypothetical protein JTE90_010350 [Oedothorax gibbosus]
MDQHCRSQVAFLWVVLIATNLAKGYGEIEYFTSNKDNTVMKKGVANLLLDELNTETSQEYINFINEKYEYLKWPNHQVPYKISRKLPKGLRKLIFEAIKTWNEAFADCLPWVRRKTTRDYVLFKKSDFMCHSEVGRMYGRQPIFLAQDICGKVGSILHEMAHAVGLTHEHNRPDRNKYISINFLNIPAHWRLQYKIDEGSVNQELGPYDYYSLMHYKYESPDRLMPAFEVLNKNVNTTLIGHATGFSDIDKLKIKRLYCPEKIGNNV